MDDRTETRILADYLKALESKQARLVRCLGFKLFREKWLQDYYG